MKRHNLVCKECGQFVTFVGRKPWSMQDQNYATFETKFGELGILAFCTRCKKWAFAKEQKIKKTGELNIKVNRTGAQWFWAFFLLVFMMIVMIAAEIFKNN